MKYRFNEQEFIIESAQWWTAPEVLPSTRWVIGLKHTDEHGKQHTVVRPYVDQTDAEASLVRLLGRIETRRKERLELLIAISQRIGLLPSERQKHYKYLNYWLDKELSQNKLVERFPKDHPKWKPAPRAGERPDSNRNPYRSVYDQYRAHEVEVARQVAADSYAREQLSQSGMVQRDESPNPYPPLRPVTRETLERALREQVINSSIRSEAELRQARELMEAELAQAERRVAAPAGVPDVAGNLEWIANPVWSPITVDTGPEILTPQRPPAEQPPARTEEEFLAWLEEE